MGLKDPCKILNELKMLASTHTTEVTMDYVLIVEVVKTKSDLI